MNRFLDFCNCFVILPISSSVLYITFRDVYKVYISEEQKYLSKLTIKSLINPGLFVGGLFGILGFTIGYPIIPKLLGKIS